MKPTSMLKSVSCNVEEEAIQYSAEVRPVFVFMLAWWRVDVDVYRIPPMVAFGILILIR